MSEVNQQGKILVSALGKPEPRLKPDILTLSTCSIIRRMVQRVKVMVSAETHRVDDALDLRAQNLFRAHPFQESPEFLQDFPVLIAYTDGFPNNNVFEGIAEGLSKGFETRVTAIVGG